MTIFWSNSQQRSCIYSLINLLSKDCRITSFNNQSFEKNHAYKSSRLEAKRTSSYTPRDASSDLTILDFGQNVIVTHQRGSLERTRPVGSPGASKRRPPEKEGWSWMPALAAATAVSRYVRVSVVVVVGASRTVPMAGPKHEKSDFWDVVVRSHYYCFPRLGRAVVVVVVVATTVGHPCRWSVVRFHFANR